jgi:hypothetical protein
VAEAEVQPALEPETRPKSVASARAPLEPDYTIARSASLRIFSCDSSHFIFACANCSNSCVRQLRNIHCVSFANRVFEKKKMTDPVLNVLSQISHRNKDAKLAGAEKLKGDVTSKRYVGVVEAPLILLVKRLTDAGVALSEIQCSQDTEGSGGMQLTVFWQKGVDNFKALQQKRNDNLLDRIILVLVLIALLLLAFPTFM